MTDDANAAASAVAQPSAAPVADNSPSTSISSAPDDFDENQIPESSRENFRKYRESQQTKAKEWENKLSTETRQRLEAEARASQYEQRLRPAEDNKELGPEPDYKEFRTIEEYRDALKVWNKKAAIAEYKAGQTQQQTQQQEAEQSAKRAAKGQQAMQKHADFAQLLRPLIPVIDSIPVLGMFVDESERGTDVLYEFLKNPVLLEGLRKMSPFAAGKELLRIEAALSAPVTKAVTQAPDPLNPVSTGGDGNVRGILDLVKKDDVSDFVARENRKIIRSKRGE